MSARRDLEPPTVVDEVPCPVCGMTPVPIYEGMDPEEDTIGICIHCAYDMRHDPNALSQTEGGDNE